MPEKRTPLRLAADYRHHYRGANGYPGFCRVRVFEPEPSDAPGPVVLMSEPGHGTDSGPSVTNAVEIIAAEVVVRYALPSSETAFVEHYERGLQKLASGIPEAFDLVTFSKTDPEPVLRSGAWRIQFRLPDWKHLDRADVEALTGQPLKD